MRDFLGKKSNYENFLGFDTKCILADKTILKSGTKGYMSKIEDIIVADKREKRKGKDMITTFYSKNIVRNRKDVISAIKSIVNSAIIKSLFATNKNQQPLFQTVCWILLSQQDKESKCKNYQLVFSRFKN